MPTPSLMVLPKSGSSDEFENICKDVLSELYHRSFTRYGRQGQKQQGIDIYARYDDDLFIVAQCKNYYRPDSTQRLIEQMKLDITSAQNSDFDIKIFVAMTSMDRDTTVQDAFRKNNSIITMFWDDIQEIVCSNNRLLLKHYPSLFINLLTPVEILNQILGHLQSLGYYAHAFREKQGYSAGYNEWTDTSIYKQCIAMFSEAYSLSNIMYAWNLQLDEIGILESLRKIVEYMPETHDESEDGLGTSMILTVHNYISFFCERKNHEAFSKDLIKAEEKLRGYSKKLSALPFSTDNNDIYQ